MSLQGKFQLIVGLAAVGLLTLAAFWLTTERSRILSAKREQAKNLVQIAYVVIERQYEKEVAGEISREEAQQRAIATIRAMRYSHDGYFVVLFRKRMLVDPLRPDLEGKISIRTLQIRSLERYRNARTRRSGKERVLFPIA